MTIKSLIRTVPHYPKQGVMFRDITTLLKDPVGFRITINEFVHRYTAAKIDKIAGIESRGFIIGSALAFQDAAMVARTDTPRFSSAWVSCRYAKRASCPPRPWGTTTNWNTVLIASNCTSMQ